MKSMILGFFLIMMGNSFAGEANTSAKNLGHYKKLKDDVYLLVLQPGAKILESLIAFQKETGITSGSVSGLGVTRHTILGAYTFLKDGSPGKFHTDVVVEKPREVTNLNCILTTVVVENGKPEVAAPPHCHITIAGADDPAIKPVNGYPALGGHLVEAEVAVTAELIISTYSTPVVKVPSQKYGGIVIDINESQGGSPLFPKE